MAQAAAALGVPGLGVAVAAPDVRTTMVWGDDSTGPGRPVGADTWFSVASSGKHLTACAILNLARAGKIDIVAPLGRYMPDAPPAWRDRSVRSLLRHTSGLPEYLTYEEGETPPEDRDGFMRAYATLQPVFAEGDAWMYSNTNYILLGFLVAQLAGRSYAHTVQALLDRAGPGAAVSSPEWARAQNQAGTSGHARDAASARRAVIGDGDASFTVDGAVNWLQALLAEGPLDAAVRAELFSPATFRTTRPLLYGCGFFVEPLGDNRICHHAGHYDGWSAMICLAPAHGAGVMLMTSHAPGNTRAVRFLAQLALEECAPGSTPLSLTPIADARPDLTSIAHTQLLRPEGRSPDLQHFAPELRRMIERGGPFRGAVNLWSGESPGAFQLVSEHPGPGFSLRRYRITYAQRTEHLLTGVSGEDQLFWATPL